MRLREIARLSVANRSRVAAASSKRSTAASCACAPRAARAGARVVSRDRAAPARRARRTRRRRSGLGTGRSRRRAGPARRARRRRAGSARQAARAAAQRHRRLDRLPHEVRDGGRGERTEVGGAVGLGDARDREPREPLVRELQVRVLAPHLGLAVEPGLEGLDQPDLAHRGLERAAAHEMVDRHRLPQELRHLAAVVGREVRADARAQVRGLPDVEHAARRGRGRGRRPAARQPRGEGELRRRRMRAHAREQEQVVEPEHAERRGPLEQRVQHLGRRLRVGERAVDRLGRDAEVARQRGEPEVRNLVAHESPRDRERVDVAVREARSTRRDQRGVEERDVEADVVADDHRVADELEQRGEHLFDARRGQHHRLGDAGEHGDERRDRHAGVDERLEAAEAFAAAQLHRADLGDRAVARRGAGGLEVDDDERDLGEGLPEVVEGGLPLPRGGCGGEPGQGRRGDGDHGRPP